MSIFAIRPTLQSKIFTRNLFGSKATTNLAIVIGGAGFVTLLAYISFPVPGSPVPITGQTLGVLLIGTSYGSRLGIASLLTYAAVGVAGVPVFAYNSTMGHGGGWARMVGATGGYIFGMIIASFVIGLLAERKWDKKIRTALPTMLIGETIIFTTGLTWLQSSTGMSWNDTISKGFTPFIFGEVIKLAIAGLTLPIIWRFLTKKK